MVKVPFQNVFEARGKQNGFELVSHVRLRRDVPVTHSTHRLGDAFILPKASTSVDCIVRKKYVEKIPCSLSHLTDLIDMLGGRYLEPERLLNHLLQGVGCAVTYTRSFWYLNGFSALPKMGR